MKIQRVVQPNRNPCTLRRLQLFDIFTSVCLAWLSPRYGKILKAAKSKSARPGKQLNKSLAKSS